MMTQHDEAVGPYAQAAHQYWAAGWRGVLPLPPNRKASPPTGWTGRQGLWPSQADIQAWIEGTEGAGNIGLRLPDDIIGLDVDNYSGKLGAATLAAAEHQYGPLPATWRSTSRDDGISGIRLYRIPTGLAWPGELGPGTEIIQHIHRYTVAWPSIHPEGRVYRWINPDGVTTLAVPPIDELPELPDTWVTGITQGRMFEDLPKANLSDVEANSWILTHGGGEQCPAVRMTVDHYIADRLTGTSSRHDAARDATARLFHMAAEGHTGVVAAVNEIGMAFRGAILADSNRTHDQGEWQRLYLGAVRLAAVNTTGQQPADPCNVTVLDVSVLDVSTVTQEQAAEATQERALTAELAQQRLRRDARRLLDNEEASKAFRVPPSTWTLVEELTIPDEPITYTVEDVMPAGANVLLTAQFKAGKTTLVNHLTRCLADQEKFLGRFNVAPPDGRIALFNYEVDDRQYRRWLRELNIAGAPLVSVLNLRGYRLPLISSHVENWIVEWLTQRDVKVWIVDPFARAFTGSGASENDNTEVGRFLDTLDVIKERAGVSDLILPTHTGRAELEQGQERARGATRLDDWADVRWMLTKDTDDVRYFSATGRDVEFPEAALAFDDTTRAPRIIGESRAKESNKRLDSAIIAVIEATPGITLRQLRVAVRQIMRKATNTDIDDAVTMAEAGRRVRIEDGPRGAHLHFLAGPTPINSDSEA